MTDDTRAETLRKAIKLLEEAHPYVSAARKFYSDNFHAHKARDARDCYQDIAEFIRICKMEGLDV